MGRAVNNLINTGINNVSITNLPPRNEPKRCRSRPTKRTHPGEKKAKGGEELKNSLTKSEKTYELSDSIEQQVKTSAAIARAHKAQRLPHRSHQAYAAS